MSIAALDVLTILFLRHVGRMINSNFFIIVLSLLRIVITDNTIDFDPEQNLQNRRMNYRWPAFGSDQSIWLVSAI